ncbi:NADPH-dependent assimilatory sulfite reductase flavoprotein subunit [Parabacteroides sp. Marseille-P3160]|uniref:NADPH-dependent assimilatory sulfite reductase flavoprotein subunit n=1 Tax=Parabacteroides sp. Marseille-P3160 TaxID=1917887 RepID=UPI0009B95513|nr:NADPH-dependent assimilatory sulfite reductase flavoprotein subunit [Parabacteroides sp. Marseille-P3160]
MNINPNLPSIPLTDEQLAHLKAMIKDSTPQQLAWLSGYLWGLQHTSGEGAEQESLSTPANPKTTIISASQTGNARKIAERLEQSLKEEGYPVNLQKAGEYKYKQIAQEKLVFIVTSTQGEGEAPEEALPLYKYLFSKKAPRLPNLKFAVFGLGDSSYQNFCKAGKDFDSRLSELGASRILNREDADISFQEKADAWRNAVVEYVKKNIPQKSIRPSAGKPLTPVIENKYGKENPFKAKVITNQKITSRDSEKDVRHIELDLTGSGLRYRPGDSLGVWYKNDARLIEEILELFDFPKDTLVTVQEREMTLFDALREHYELTQNTTVILEKYAAFLPDKALDPIVSDKPAAVEYVGKNPLVDLFRQYPAKLTPAQFLGLLRPLTPRYYSIASSQDEVGEEVHMTVGVIDYISNSRERKGGASGYLSSLAEEDEVSVFIEQNDNFRLPEDPEASIIMIGPGTGIAPFRAFIQQREAEAAAGRNWLFFGNPHFTSDFLYQSEWQLYHNSGLLSRVNFAWSRDQERKIYVQDKLREQGAEIWEWISNGAHLYVCGDANRMARDVESALLDIIKQYGKMDGEEAESYLNDLRSDKHYQRDIY